GRLEGVELDVAVGENEHAPAFDAPMHAAGHLEDLVRAEVLLREDVSPPVDRVEELHVVDDHGVEPAHVERALAGGGHGEEERLALAALEKRTDDTNRFAAVVERGVDARRRVSNVVGGVFDSAPRRNEERDAAAVLPGLAQKSIVEEFERTLAEYTHLRRPR